MEGGDDGDSTMMCADQSPQDQDASVEGETRAAVDSRCQSQIAQAISNKQWLDAGGPGGVRASLSHKQAKVKFRDAISGERRKHSQPSNSIGVKRS